MFFRRLSHPHNPVATTAKEPRLDASLPEPVANIVATRLYSSGQLQENPPRRGLYNHEADTHEDLRVDVSGLGVTNL
jgi:hypothetical protein